MTVPSCGFSLALSGMMIPPLTVCLPSESLDQNPVVERFHRHDISFVEVVLP